VGAQQRSLGIAMKISKTRRVILVVMIVLVMSFYLILFSRSVREFLGIPEGETGEEIQQRIQRELKEETDRLYKQME
jgi:hypothetical protein